jgi:hypothetical protein
MLFWCTFASPQVGANQDGTPVKAHPGGQIMTKISISLWALASAMVVTPAAFAGPLNPITGSISVSGNDIDTFNSTKITFTGNGTATGSGGSLAGVNGSVTLTSFTYASSNGVELFDVTAGPDEPVTFTIDGSVDLLVDLPGVVVFTGEGWLTEAGGYAPTIADFTLSSSGSGTATSLEITAAPQSTVPEPSSLMFLGTGLLGLAFVAFRKANPSGLVMRP